MLEINSTPPTPASLILVTQASSSGLTATPVIKVTGIRNGDVVKIFTDNNCSIEVARGTAAGSAIELTTSALADGNYSFYASAENSQGKKSSCSAATVSYTKNSCPTGFIVVPHNTTYETTADFCVSKYEMRCAGASCPTSAASVNSVPTSTSAGIPMGFMSQPAAIAACDFLNNHNGVVNKYSLISNPEWMTIAVNAENVNSNWSGGIPGSGLLNIGWSLPANNYFAPSSDGTCLYNTGGNTCAATGSHEYRRTHQLSNGEEIWDFSGNAWEWSSWQVTPANKAYIAAFPANVDRGYQEFKDLNANIGISDEMRQISFMPSNPSLVSTDGIGIYYNGLNSGGGAGLRGGGWAIGSASGIFALYLGHGPGAVYVDFSYRCVYKP